MNSQQEFEQLRKDLQVKAMSKERQLDRLRKHLIQGHSITPLDAWQQLGIYRLAARIHDLKHSGLPIQSQLVKVHNQYGEEYRVAEYWL